MVFVYSPVKGLNFQSAAAATIVCAATIVTAVAATVIAVATAADENEKDDNPAAVTAAEEAVTHVIFPPFVFTLYTITKGLYRLQIFFKMRHNRFICL